MTLWAQLARRHPTQWDQKLLQRAWNVLHEGQVAPETMWLPDAYLTKIDAPGGAVILHH